MSNGNKYTGITFLFEFPAFRFACSLLIFYLLSSRRPSLLLRELLLPDILLAVISSINRRGQRKMVSKIAHCTFYIQVCLMGLPSSFPLFRQFFIHCSWFRTLFAHKIKKYRQEKASRDKAEWYIFHAHTLSMSVKKKKRRNLVVS